MLDDFTRAQRRRYIGSSDAAALVGLDPWGQYRWRRVRRENGPRPGAPIDSGNGTRELSRARHPCVDGSAARHADPARRLSRASEQRALREPRRCRHVRHAARDHRSENRGVAWSSASTSTEFGEAGTDDIPAHVLVQVHHQMAVAEGQPDFPPIDLVIVPTLLVIGRGFVLFRVQKNAELCESIVEEGERFWREHVRRRTSRRPRRRRSRR